MCIRTRTGVVVLLPGSPLKTRTEFCGVMSELCRYITKPHSHSVLAESVQRIGISSVVSQTTSDVESGQRCDLYAVRNLLESAAKHEMRYKPACVGDDGGSLSCVRRDLPVREVVRVSVECGDI